MSQSKRNVLKSSQNDYHVLIRRCMGIVLKSLENERQKCSGKDGASNIEHAVAEGPGPPEYCLGPELFQGLVRENVECYWNPTLVQCVRDLEYKGCLSPSTILVSGSEYDFEVVRSAWARRLLRPPNGYDIVMLGDMDPMKMCLVSQTQFAPLPEALCKVVYDLNTEGSVANMSIIGKKLKSTFPEIILPEENVLYRALGSLIRERKLYHTGHGYSVVTPDTFRLLAMSPPLERQILLTNEEAIVRLHGACSTIDRQACTQTNQRLSTTAPLTTWSSCERILCPSSNTTTTNSQLQGQQGKLKRCHSLKLLRGKEKDKLCRSNSFRAATASPISLHDSKSDAENIDPNKKEKPASMFSKLFRRGRTDKSKSLPNRSCFSSQFPPRDRSDPDFVHYNSRSTQTADEDETSSAKAKVRSRSLNRVSSNKDRHSQIVTSTPMTPKTGRRSTNSGHSADTYHIRSSSLSRRTSPSPKRESSRTSAYFSSTNSYRKISPKPSNRNRQQTANRNSNETQVKYRPKYESPFYPVRSSVNGWSLKAGDKYNDFQWHSPKDVSLITDIKLPVPISSVDNSAIPKHFITTTSPSVRNSNGANEIIKPSPIVGVPHRTVINRDITNIPSTLPSLISPSLTTKLSETKENTSGSKTVHVGGVVDVEISVNPHKKGLLTTDLSNKAEKDLVKIATTWNHTISNKITKSANTTKTNPATVTTSATITTSLTKGNNKDIGTVKTLSDAKQASVKDPMKMIKSTTVVDCTGKCTIVSETPVEKTFANSGATSRSDLAEAKRDFFAESPCSTDAHCSKDDSGFSSSTSTSRPMSVSPC